VITNDLGYIWIRETRILLNDSCLVVLTVEDESYRIEKSVTDITRPDVNCERGWRETRRDTDGKQHHVPFLGRGTFGSGWQRQIELGESRCQLLRASSSGDFSNVLSERLPAYGVWDRERRRKGGDTSSTSSSPADVRPCSSAGDELLGASPEMSWFLDTACSVAVSGMILDLKSGSGWVDH
jgi:hypothetical protein